MRPKSDIDCRPLKPLKHRLPSLSGEPNAPEAGALLFYGPSIIDGCQRDWDALPPPGPPLTVGLDGGFIHAKDQKSRGEGWFEVIAGKSMPEEGAAKCFAYVQTYDTKPKRRLFELMKSQGLQANQQVTFLSDGADDVRELPLYLSPESEHWLARSPAFARSFAIRPESGHDLSRSAIHR